MIDRTSINTAITSASSQNGWNVRIRTGTYIIDSDIILASNVNLVFDPMVTIKARDSFTLSATTTNGSTTITMPDTTGIAVGMYLLDDSHSISGGSFGGVIPHGCKVVSVTTNTSITVTGGKAPTGSGAKTLRFYPNINILKATSISNFSLVCPTGWAYIDGNYAHAYPYDDNSNDATGNGLRIVSASDWYIDGIHAQNCRYHGGIVVGNLSNGRIGRYRSYNQGFRHLHYHAEGTVSLAVRSMYCQSLEGDLSGRLSFKTRGTAEYNSGFYLALDNVVNLQVERCHSKNNLGNGFHLAGGAVSYASYPSKNHQVANLITEGSGLGMYLSSYLQNVQIGNWLSVGDRYFSGTTSANFVDSADTTKYYVQMDGTVASVLARKVEIPAGDVTAYSLRAGMRAYASNGTTGMQNTGTKVWDVEIGTGTGGRDVVWLFKDDNTAQSPYTSSASGTYIYLYSSDVGLFMYAASASEALTNIQFGNVTIDTCGRDGLTSQWDSSTVRFLNIDFGHVTLRNIGGYGTYIGSLDRFSFSSLRGENWLSRIPTATVSGSYNAQLFNSVNGEIRNFTYVSTRSGADNNERLRADSACRNVSVYPVGLQIPSGSAALNMQQSAVTANTAGFQGASYIIDPRGSDGSVLTFGASQLSRGGSTAVICSKPVDVST